MTVPPKWRERRDAIKAAMPPVTRAGAPDAGETSRVTHNLALHTSVPPEDLHGLSGIDMGSKSIDSENNGEYFYGSRQLLMKGDYAHPGWSSRTQDRLAKRREFTGTLTHEIGHHADNMLSPAQFKGSTGRAEAVAENYADTHASHRESSYDQPVWMSHALTKKYLGGNAGVQDYTAYRGAGVMPGKTITEAQQFGEAPDYTPAGQKFRQKMRGR